MWTILTALCVLTCWLVLSSARGAAGAKPQVDQPVAAPTSTGGPPPMEVTYGAGWNIVAVTTPSNPFGPVAKMLYTLRPGDSDYEVVTTDSVLQPGVGYWVYIPRGFGQLPNYRRSCEMFVP